MSLVFFDFDGTLTTRDTILPLGRFLIRAAHSDRRRKTARLVLLLLCLKLRLLSNHRFKEAFCRLVLRDKSEAEIDTLSQRFVERYVGRVLNVPVVEAMRNHQRNGDEVYLLSSNFSFLLRLLQRSWGADGVIGTDAEIDGGLFTGRISGHACDGRDKLARVLSVFDLDRVRGATAYGDSGSDRHVLEFVKTGIWV